MADFDSSVIYGDLRVTGDVSIAGSFKLEDLKLTGYLTRNGHSKGCMIGSYNNVGQNWTMTNPIYTIGDNYKPTDSELKDMYGIGYTNSKAAFLGAARNYCADGWGLYVASSGQARHFLDSSSGNLWSVGKHYSSGFGTDNSGMLMCPSNSNEVNFITGNSNTSIYFGYRKKGSVVTNKYHFWDGSESAGKFAKGEVNTGHLTVNGNIHFKRVERQHLVWYNSADKPTAYIWKDPETNFLTHTAKSLFDNGVWTGYTNFDRYHNWAGTPLGAEMDNTGGGAGICNDNVNYKGLMILGNRSAGGNRVVKVWDELVCNGRFTEFSDRRVKTNIEKIDNAMEKISQLNGYTYDRTDIKLPRQTGVIAQEVQKVLPEAVSSSFDIGEEKLTVAYGNMIGLLIEGIKEQQSEIVELKQLVKELTNKIS